MKIRAAYLARSDLLAGDRDARRLLEDLLVLTAPLHLILCHGDLDRASFLREMVLVQRAFFGSPTTPLVGRLRTLDEEAPKTNTPQDQPSASMLAGTGSNESSRPDALR